MTKPNHPFSDNNDPALGLAFKVGKAVLPHVARWAWNRRQNKNDFSQIKDEEVQMLEQELESKKFLIKSIGDTTKHN